MDTTTIPEDLRKPLLSLLLCAADEKLLLGHRNGDWTGLGPFLEEDIAFSNIAQDEIAHAQELYKLAAALGDPQADVAVEADRLAFGRRAAQRLSATLVETSDHYDWAVAIARQCFYDHYDLVRLPRLQRSSWKPVADLAGKMIQEIRFHADHFDGWIAKLGQGTEESRARLQRAVDHLWPEALGLFEPLRDQHKLTAGGLYPGDDDEMRREWCTSVEGLLTRAGLSVPTTEAPASGGRAGRHTPELDDLLADFAEVYNEEPGAAW